MNKLIAFGLIFASHIELARYMILRSKLEAGQITDLESQPIIILAPPHVDASGVRWPAIKYTPDFAYTEDGFRIFEEVKPAAKSAPSVTRRDWKVRQAWAARVHPDAIFRTITL